MASPNLDDFFAKKDKKKGKKKKYTTSSTIAQTLEASQNASSQEAKKDIKVDIPNAPTQDSEWKDDEMPTQDLEGLRVQSLSTHSQTDGGSVKQEHQECEDGDGDNESGKPKAQQSPWQQQQPDSDVPPLQQQQPVEITSGGAYIPPSRRQQSQGSRPGRPPDILNDQAFPSLQASAKKEHKPKEKQHGDFTEVRQYRGRATDSTYSSPQLELTNKYEALRNN